MQSRKTPAATRAVPTGKLWTTAAQADHYDGACNRQFYRSLMARLLEKAPACQGVGLDLGCGSGFSTEVLLDEYPAMKWYGVDASQSMLHKLREKENLASVCCLTADALQLPFADACLDLVVSNFSWHWFSDGTGAEVARVLKPFGYLLATVPLRGWSDVPGNRMLARLALARRQHHARRKSQGYTLGNCATLLSGAQECLRLEAMGLDETFPDLDQMLDSLQSRGALGAILGEAEVASIPGSMVGEGAVDYHWPFAVVHLRRLPQ